MLKDELSILLGSYWVKFIHNGAIKELNVLGQEIKEKRTMIIIEVKVDLTSTAQTSVEVTEDIESIVTRAIGSNGITAVSTSEELRVFFGTEFLTKETTIADVIIELIMIEGLKVSTHHVDAGRVLNSYLADEGIL